MNDASVVKTVVDICSRSFMILSDEGDVQVVYCQNVEEFMGCLLYTSPSPRDLSTSRMPSSA